MDIPNDSRKYLDWVFKKTVTTTDAMKTIVSTASSKVSKKFPCYDHYFCDIPAVVFVNHVLMGVIAFIFCLIGILGNTILIPIFNMTGIKSSATVYMTGIAVCDTISLILVVIMIAVKNLPATFSGQLKMHQTFTGYLLGFGLPVKELVDLLSLWLVIALLIDRFLYRKNMARLNVMSNRSHYVKILLILIIMLAVYTIPKFLKYKLVETSAMNNTMHVRIMMTNLAQNNVFITSMLWLKLLLEIAIPYLIMVTMVVILSYSLLSKKTTFEYNCPSRTVSQEKIKIRERSNTVAVLFIGVLMLCCKLPGFVLSIISYKPNINHELFLKMHLTSDFLNLFTLWLKPFVYLICCRHLRQVCLDMFCLFFCPGKTREIVLAGGLGAAVTIENGSRKKEVHRCPTTLTLVSISEGVGLGSNSDGEFPGCDTLFIKKEIARRAAQELELAKASAVTNSTNSSNNVASLAGDEDNGSDEGERPFFHVEEDECDQNNSQSSTVRGSLL